MQKEERKLLERFEQDLPRKYRDMSSEQALQQWATKVCARGEDVEISALLYTKANLDTEEKSFCDSIKIQDYPLPPQGFMWNSNHFFSDRKVIKPIWHTNTPSGVEEEWGYITIDDFSVALRRQFLEVTL